MLDLQQLSAEFPAQRGKHVMLHSVLSSHCSANRRSSACDLSRGSIQELSEALDIIQQGFRVECRTAWDRSLTARES